MDQAAMNATQFVICIQNTNYPVALEIRKIYVVVADRAAADHQLIRVIDESGEDYLYPSAYFLPITLPQAIQEALLAA
jgi:hypothetical protein